MYALPVILFAAIDTASWSIDEIRAWADRQIREADCLPSWLVELSTSTSLDQAAEAVRGELRNRLTLPEDFSTLLMGLIYLRFRTGSISKEQLLRDVGDVVDAYGGSAFDVESWYQQMEAPGIPAQVETALQGFALQAEASLLQLQTTRNAADELFWRP
jgi:hypothetical protein